MTYLYHYHPKKNPAYRAPTDEDPDPVWTPDAIPGVPVRSLDADDLRTMSARLRASVAACPFYVVADPAALAALEAELGPPAEAPGELLGGAEDPVASRRRRHVKTAEEGTTTS